MFEHFAEREAMSLLAILAGAITGIILGLFGSGGSILTVPALLYLLDTSPKAAIAMSLGIVAVTATISAFDNWRRGNVNLKIALMFSAFGVVGTYAGARVGVHTPAVLQLGLFAVVMYAAAYKMLRPGKAELKPVGAEVVHPLRISENSVNMLHIALHGLGVGMLTGLVGVGGGFLIVPALVLLSGIPMKQAVGTSLAIVAAKSYAGFAGYFGAVQIDYALMATFTSIAIGGSFIGTRIAHRISNVVLKQSFAIFLVIVATYILFKSVV